MSGTGLRTGQLAETAGVNVQTLRYYERRGLLAAPDRTLGGHRLYPPESVTVLRVIKAAQRLGFTLDDIAALLEAGQHHHDRRGAGLRACAAAKLDEVEAKLADLAIIRDTLRAALDAGCADLMDCADSPRCPLPFGDLAAAKGARPGTTGFPVRPRAGRRPHDAAGADARVVRPAVPGLQACGLGR